MGMLESYLYLLGTLYLLAVWLLFFLLKKNRKEMLYMSMTGAALGPVAQYFHLQDWWSPEFIYGFPIHIEDLLFGFAVLGIASVCYETVFREYERRVPRSNTRVTTVFAYSVVIMGFLFFLVAALVLHSLAATIIGSVLIIVLILHKRPDFLQPMFATGALLPVISIPAYLVPLSIDPTWVDTVWFNENLTGARVAGIPIEEFVWYFFIGASLSALWELAHNTRFVRMRA